MNSNIKDLEKTLWAAADKMRGGVSVTNYKLQISNSWSYIPKVYLRLF